MEFALDIANPRPRNDRFFEEKFPGPPSGSDLSINPDQGMIPPDQNNPKNKRPPPPSQKWPTYNFLLSAIFITGFSIGMRYTEKVIHQEKLQEEKEKERLNAELAFLKNQINPHFFFNTLNNIYSLVEINVNDGQKAILQLSKLMRYVLYETEKGNKYLSQEIDFLKNYIELMKLRLSSKVTLSFTVPENYRDIQIPPLIFLPFIENAFKHGISSHNPSFITISLTTREDEIFFECTNSIGGKNKDLYKKDNGIGLENIKKRLSILFPKSHKLQIVESQTTFNVNLYIDNRVSEEV
jgi:LytS/YehU family sensor histidine kinase